MSETKEQDTSIIKHKKLGFDFRLPEILQGDLEKFENVFDQYRDAQGGIKLAVFNGAIVRTAAELGWLPDITADQVEKMKPSAVTFLTNKIALHIEAARTVPLD